MSPPAYRTRLPRSQGARPCLLYRVHDNMRGRAHGKRTKSPWVYAEGWPWPDYAAFRVWALASGFCKARPSPDRIRTHEPYGPSNVRWVAKRVNNSTSSGRCWYMRDEPSEWDKYRSGETQPGADVPF